MGGTEYVVIFFFFRFGHLRGNSFAKMRKQSLEGAVAIGECEHQLLSGGGWEGLPK